MIVMGMAISKMQEVVVVPPIRCLLYTSPSPRDQRGSGVAACG